MKVYSRKQLALLAALSILIPYQVQAEESSLSLETITVTAQKQEENVQNVPISMDVFSAMDLEENRITEMKQLTPYIPNLFTTPSLENNSIVIRGISTHNTVLHPAAGIFVDDIPYPLNRMQDPELLDIERVEVLRGPQGTLYGKNTESGAINIITRQPDNKVRGKIFADAGFFDADDKVPIYELDGHLSGPLMTDKLFAKVVFHGKSSDGYITNINNMNDEASKIDRKIGQMTLRWTPADQWDISFITDIAQNNNHYGQLRYADGPGQSPHHTINWNGGNDWAADSNNQVLRIRYNAKDFNFLSITSRSDYRTEFTNDADFGPFEFQNQDFIFDVASYSQELRISSPGEKEQLSWVAGVFGSREETYAKSHTPAFFAIRDTDMEYESLALFGQATYTIFNNLHLTAGARYEHQNTWGKQRNIMSPMFEYSRSDSNDEFLPKVSVAYDVTENMMAYVSYARGFLSGGHDFHMANSVEDLYFDPEHTNSYEAGIKTSFLNQRVIVNADVFHIDISDKQVVEYPVGGSPIERDVTNAAEASSQGFEIELTARPAAGLNLFAGLGYTKSVFDNWLTALPSGASFDYNGNYLADAPEFTFHLGARYHVANGLFLGADLLGVGDYYHAPENTQKIDGYETVNLKIGYEQETFDVVLWADNVFDKEYFTSKFRWQGTLVNEGAPRSMGIRFTYRF